MRPPPMVVPMGISQPRPGPSPVLSGAVGTTKEEGAPLFVMGPTTYPHYRIEASGGVGVIPQPSPSTLFRNSFEI